MAEHRRHPKRLLVTGGAGFIGSAFARWVLAHAPALERIVDLDALTYAGNLDNLREVMDDPRHVFVHGDIADRGLLDRLCDEHELDAIVHFAAESHVDRSIEGPLQFVSTNVVGTANLLEAARARPHIHFHHVSTDEVFGSLGPTGAFVESSPYRPSSPYAASKAAADHLVRAWAHTYGISTTLSSCSNNYGPGQFPEKLVPVMLACLLARRPLPIYGDGHNVRDWLYVEDHAEAVWAILTRGRAGESYNVGGGAERSNLALVEELIAQVARTTGAPEAELHALISFVPDRPGHDDRYALDWTKLRDELGWQPRHSLARGLALTVDWYLRHPQRLDVGA